MGAFSHKLECSTLVDASRKYLFFHEGAVYFGGNETSVHFIVKGGVVWKGSLPGTMFPVCPSEVSALLTAGAPGHSLWPAPSWGCGWALSPEIL